MLSTAALATVANPYAVPPLQPNAVGPGGAYWAPPPPPQQTSDEPAVAKKKGGPSKRKERKYTIEQLRAALYATIGAAARGAPRRPAVATPLPPSPLLSPSPVKVWPSRCGVNPASVESRRRARHRPRPCGVSSLRI